jgi:hypothetical protein
MYRRFVRAQPPPGQLDEVARQRAAVWPEQLRAQPGFHLAHVGIDWATGTVAGVTRFDDPPDDALVARLSGEFRATLGEGGLAQPPETTVYEIAAEIYDRVGDQDESPPGGGHQAGFPRRQGQAPELALVRRSVLVQLLEEGRRDAGHGGCAAGRPREPNLALALIGGEDVDDVGHGDGPTEALTGLGGERGGGDFALGA